MTTEQSEEIAISIGNENTRSKTYDFVTNIMTFLMASIIIVLIGFLFLYILGFIYDYIYDTNNCNEIISCLLCGIMAFATGGVTILVCGIIGIIIIGTVFLVIMKVKELRQN